MKRFSKKGLRFLSIASIALALTVGFSCKKDNKDPNPPTDPGPNGGGNSVTASADLKFLPEGETVHFKSYETGFVATLMGDTNLVCVFGTEDQYGNDIDTLSIGFGILDPTGIQVGKVYTVPDATNNIISAHAKKKGEYISSVYSALDLSLGEIIITSLTENHIKGTFTFTGYVADMVDPEDPSKRKVIVSNGKFDCKLLSM